MPDPPPTLTPAEHAAKWRRDLKRPGAPRERRTVDGEVIELVGDERVEGPAERMDIPDDEIDESGKPRDWAQTVAKSPRRRAYMDARLQRLRGRQTQRERLSYGSRLDLALRLLAPRVGGMRAKPIESYSPSAESEQVGPGAPPSDLVEAVEEKLGFIRQHVAALEDLCELEPRMRWRSEGERVDRAITSLPIPVGGEVIQHVSLIRHHIRAIESYLDADDGLLRTEPPAEQGFYGQPGRVGGWSDARMMTAAERDKLVFEDFQGVPAELVAREAEYLGGHPKTIVRARRNEAERRNLRVNARTGEVLGEAEARAA